MKTIQKIPYWKMVVGILILIVSCSQLSFVPTQTAAGSLLSQSNDGEGISASQLVWYDKPESPAPLTVFQYGRVNQPLSPIYISLRDAVYKTENYKRSQGSALVYMSYSDTVVVDNQIYYRVGADEWMTEDELIPEQYSDFSGVVLANPVENDFGWVLEDRNSIVIDEKSGDEKQGGRYHRYQVLPVLSIKNKDNPPLYEVAPGEWMPEESFSYLNSQGTPPAKVKNCRWIEVSISQQNLAVYDECKLIFATLISSGRKPGWTASGIYPIGRKEEYLTLTDLNPSDPDSYYLQDVPWVMVYAGSWAIHAAYWHDNFGFPFSHGCLTLSPLDARYLYSWVKWGDVLNIIE